MFCDRSSSLCLKASRLCHRSSLLCDGADLLCSKAGVLCLSSSPLRAPENPPGRRAGGKTVCAKRQTKGGKEPELPLTLTAGRGALTDSSRQDAENPARPPAAAKTTIAERNEKGRREGAPHVLGLFFVLFRFFRLNCLLLPPGSCQENKMLRLCTAEIREPITENR